MAIGLEIDLGKFMEGNTPKSYEIARRDNHYLERSSGDIELYGSSLDVKYNALRAKYEI